MLGHRFYSLPTELGNARVRVRVNSTSRWRWRWHAHNRQRSLLPRWVLIHIFSVYITYKFCSLFIFFPNLGRGHGPSGPPGPPASYGPETSTPEWNDTSETKWEKIEEFQIWGEGWSHWPLFPPWPSFCPTNPRPNVKEHSKTDPQKTSSSSKSKIPENIRNIVSQNINNKQERGNWNY